LLTVLEVDKDQDLAYIRLRPDALGRGIVARSQAVGDDVVLDFDANGELVGIELLNASARVDVDRVSGTPDDLIVGVKEAAELADVEKSNFIRDFANKSGFPRPIAELASGRLWLKPDVLSYLRGVQKTAQRSDTSEGSLSPVPVSRTESRITSRSVKRHIDRLRSFFTLADRARAIPRTRKARFLLSLSVVDFLNRVVKPLFSRQGLSHEEDLDEGERSNASVFSTVDQLGMLDRYIVLAHRGSLNVAGDNAATVDALARRIMGLLSLKTAGRSTSIKRPPTKLILCTSGTINESARARITQLVGDPRVFFLDTEDFIAAIDERFPELWLDIDTNLPPYLSAVKKYIEEAVDDGILSTDSGGAQVSAASDQMFVQLTLHRTRVRIVKRKGRIERKPVFEEIPVHAILRRSERLILIVGDAGSGKSTCLRRLAYILADRTLRGDEGSIPISLRATDIWSRRPRTLVDACSEQTRQMSGTRDPSFSAEDLAAGRVTLLIDALDELADDGSRKDLANMIIEFAKTYPRCQVIATSREYAFVKSLQELSVFERFRISPISYVQAEKILTRVQQRSGLPKEASKEILRRLQDIHGMELNPLLVAIFAATSDYSRRDIPANITELFKKFTELMLGRWDARKGLGQQYHAPLKDFILTRIGFEMHRRGVTALPIIEFSALVERELDLRGHKADIDELMNEIILRSGLFRVGPDTVEFRHHLLQEFFAGRGIPSVDFLDAIVADDWWQRPIVFYFGDAPSNHKGLQKIISSVAIRPAAELYRAAIAVGLALQASYLVEVREKTEIIRWVIEGLSASKDAFLALGTGEHSLPVTKLVLYYIFGRDSVACNVLEDQHAELIKDFEGQGLTTDELELRTFWVITGLLESGSVEAAERLVRKFRPDDARLALAIQLGCLLLQHLRVASPDEKRIAKRIGESLAHRTLSLRTQLMAEFHSELLEMRQGGVKAIESRDEDVALP
jgi:uncharacterized protein YuzE